MVDIAPLNYERWAVIVNPLQAPDTRGERAPAEARHTEQLIQVSPSLNRLDTRKKASLIEQTLMPAAVRRKIIERKPVASPVTSHPAGWVLRQPLPIEIFTSAGDQPAPDPGKVIELYTPPEIPPGPGVRLSG